MSRLRGSLPLLLWLTLVWVGLWGGFSAANVLGGLALALLLLLLLPQSDVGSRAVVRPLAVLRLAAYFAADLVRASLRVAAQVLSPRPLDLRPAVVALPVRAASDHLLTLLANLISLTPGTLTLEVDRPGSTLYVHVLDVGRRPDAVARVRGSLQHLEVLAVRAVGSPECRRALDEDITSRRTP